MSLTVVTGPMFAGKSRELLYKVKRAILFGHGKALFISPETDSRHPFSTHDGENLNDTGYIKKVVCPKDFYGFSPASMYPYDLVAIEEAQFFDNKLLKIVEDALTMDVSMVVAGLDLDAFGRPFGVMPQLMALATEVVKLSGICEPCGRPATRTFRKTDDREKVVVGGSDIYESRCYSCWHRGTF